MIAVRGFLIPLIISEGLHGGQYLSQHACCILIPRQELGNALLDIVSILGIPEEVPGILFHFIQVADLLLEQHENAPRIFLATHRVPFRRHEPAQLLCEVLC